MNKHKNDEQILTEDIKAIFDEKVILVLCQDLVQNKMRGSAS